MKIKFRSKITSAASSSRKGVYTKPPRRTGRFQLPESDLLPETNPLRRPDRVLGSVGDDIADIRKGGSSNVTAGKTVSRRGGDISSAAGSFRDDPLWDEMIDLIKAAKARDAAEE